MAAKETGGYDVNFLYENDRERFRCMLCMDIIKQATHGCDGHVFCKSCLEEYVCGKSGEEVLCPAGCSKLFNRVHLMPNRPIDQFINQIPCKCYDCEWQGELLDYFQHHKENCEEKRITCCYCGGFLKQKEMEEHVTNVCENRPVNCQYCLLDVGLNEHKSHEDICGNIKADCFYKIFGCTFQGALRHVKSHEGSSDESHHHLKLFTKYYSSEHAINNVLKDQNETWKNEICSRISTLNKENVDLKTSFESLKERYNDLHSSFKTLQAENVNFKEENACLIETIHHLNSKISAIHTADEKQSRSGVLKLISDIKDIQIGKYSEAFLNTLSLHSCKNIFQENANNGVVVKKHGTCQEDFLRSNREICCYASGISFICQCIVAVFAAMAPYIKELYTFFMSKSAIRVDNLCCQNIRELYFRKDLFTFFEDETFAFALHQGVFYFKTNSNKYTKYVLYIPNWKIKLTSNSVVDITKPDDRFSESYMYLSKSYYGCLELS